MTPLLLQDDPSFIFFLFFGIICLAVAVFSAVCGWMLFAKAGRPGWESLIPIYNIIIFLKIVGKPWWWIFLFCLYPLCYIWIIWSMNMLSKSFGKDEGFTVGLVFLGPIFLAILAFNKDAYKGPYGNRAAFEAYNNQYTFDFEAEKASHA